MTDHLGNVRAAFIGQSSGTPLVTQRNSYFPFGMVAEQTDSYSTGILKSKFLYNGKELQDDEVAGVKLDWYDYGARFYDPALGRFHTQDRFAEKYLDFSPYQYAANNPVLNIDMNGDSIQASQDAILAIYHALDKNTNVSFNVTNGVIEPGSFKDQAENSDDIILKDIYEIASHEKMVEVTVAEGYAFKDNEGKIQNSAKDPLRNFNAPEDYNTKDMPMVHQSLLRLGEAAGKSFNGNTGRSLFPGNNSVTGANSMNGNVQVILNAKGSLNHRAVGAAHEFGHVLLYLRGLPHKHGQSGVNSFINKRASLVSKRLGYDF